MKQDAALARTSDAAKERCDVGTLYGNRRLSSGRSLLRTAQASRQHQTCAGPPTIVLNRKPIRTDASTSCLIERHGMQSLLFALPLGNKL
jgi:hypothetical protein